MRAREAILFITKQIGNLYEKDEAGEIAWRVLEHVSGLAKFKLMSSEYLFEDRASIEKICEELSKNRPIQYVLGYEWFGGLRIQVNENVLIPRPETEELCELALKDLAKNDQLLKVIDIGTGSGCIPVFLKHKIPSLDIYAMDISKDALQVARSNAAMHKVDLNFIEEDICRPGILPGMSFSYIISNPPYIHPSEKKDMHTRVLHHEPALALFVQNDPLEFYIAIKKFADEHLIITGKMYFEINPLFADAITKLYPAPSWTCHLQKDIYGNTRFALLTKCLRS